jgi:hypothetical protein
MFLTCSIASAAQIAKTPVYIAHKGSNVPHSVYIDGNVEELLDPPDLNVVATGSPQVID